MERGSAIVTYLEVSSLVKLKARHAGSAKVFVTSAEDEGGGQGTEEFRPGEDMSNGMELGDKTGYSQLLFSNV